MKVEFYVETVSYYPDAPTPSVVIIVRNNMDGLGPAEPVIVTGPSDMKDALRKLFASDSNNHKTSFIVSLDKYEKSGIKVGDKLSVEISIDMTGGISN